MPLFEFLGRLHPLLLHMPIGMLAIAFLMELLGRRGPFKYLLPAVSFVLGVGMITAVVAAVSGYVLSLEGGYNEELLFNHKWLGIGTAVFAVLIFILEKQRESKLSQKLYIPIFTLLMILMGLTGHVGGSMTHGEDFLTEPFTIDRNKQTAVFNIDSALVFEDLIQPIFEEKCESCHNKSKIKGDLLMSTVEGLKRGGESGAFLMAGSVSNSLFLQRIALPLLEKEHMPPKGKNQLSKDEVALLKWWVEEGAEYEKHVAEMTLSDEVKIILDERTAKSNSVLAQEVGFAKEADLSKLNKIGFTIETVAEEKPFLTASLMGKKNIDRKTIAGLDLIAEQLIDLDLSNSNLSDDLLPAFTKFPNLRKLFLQNTDLSGKGFNGLSELRFLEYINIYNTPVEDDLLIELAKVESLKQLFLWKTSLSSRAIEAFKEQRIDVIVNTGIDQSIFGKSTLSAPTIIVDSEIFSDSMMVKLELNFSNVDLYYTLDGSTPDSSSLKYHNPFFLSKTSEIKVVGQKEGWESSEVASKTLVCSKHEIQLITLDKQPNEKYKAEGANSLINNKKGTTNFSEGEWLGYEKSGVIATLDMGESENLSGVTVSALESTGSYIFFPKQIEIFLSEDGASYQPVAMKAIPTTAKPEEPSIKNFFLKFEEQNGRFVKVKVASNLVNPKWHPAPGAPCWLFIDEIIVE